MFMQHVIDIGQDLFHRLYRVPHVQFLALRELIAENAQPNINRPAGIANTVDIDVRLCITLRILAGASYLDVSWP